MTEDIVFVKLLLLYNNGKVVKKILIAGILGFGLAGCTAIQVNNTTGFSPDSIKQVCIIHNPKVIINPNRV